MKNEYRIGDSLCIEYVADSAEEIELELHADVMGRLSRGDMPGYLHGQRVAVGLIGQDYFGNQRYAQVNVWAETTRDEDHIGEEARKAAEALDQIVHTNGIAPSTASLFVEVAHTLPASPFDFYHKVEEVLTELQGMYKEVESQTTGGRSLAVVD